MGAGTEEPVPEMGAQKRGRAGVGGDHDHSREGPE